MLNNLYILLECLILHRTSISNWPKLLIEVLKKFSLNYQTLTNEISPLESERKCLLWNLFSDITQFNMSQKKVVKSAPYNSVTQFKVWTLSKFPDDTVDIKNRVAIKSPSNSDVSKFIAIFQLHAQIPPQEHFLCLTLHRWWKEPE